MRGGGPSGHERLDVGGVSVLRKTKGTTSRGDFGEGEETKVEKEEVAQD